MSPTLLIAWRFLWSKRSDSALSTMAFISFISMAIGAGALALVISIMTGFEKETHKSLQSIHAQVIMQSRGNNLDIEKILPVVHTEFPAVQAASPYAMQQVIITPADSDDLSHVVMLKGIIPAQELQVTSLAQKIISPPLTSLPAIMVDNHIVVGQKLAQELNLKLGDALTLIYPETQSARRSKLSLSDTQAIVGGIFKTGISEFDEGLIYANVDWMQKTFANTAISHIAIRLQPDVDEQATIDNLKNRFGLEVYSWKELYPALVAALTLEKYAMSLILLLILLVAGMNIISLLYMHIIRKRADIALLSALGMQKHQIRLIFLLLGLGIAAAGSFFGLTVAALIGFTLQNYLRIELPDTYYVSHLPVIMEPTTFAFIFAAVLLMSAFAIFLPLRMISRISIAQILRFEG